MEPVTLDGKELELINLRMRLMLAEMSNEALLAKLKQVQRVSRSRLKRMNQRGKLLIETRAKLERLSREAQDG